VLQESVLISHYPTFFSAFLLFFLRKSKASSTPKPKRQLLAHSYQRSHSPQKTQPPLFSSTHRLYQRPPDPLCLRIPAVYLLLGLRHPLMQVLALLVQLLVLTHVVEGLPFGMLDARRVPDTDLEELGVAVPADAVFAERGDRGVGVGVVGVAVVPASVAGDAHDGCCGACMCGLD